MMFELPTHVVQISVLALAYVLLILLSQALIEELVLPRLSFSKTAPADLKQMIVRWVLFSRRFDFNFKRDVLLVMQIAILLSAIAVIPLDGEVALKVDRPDLAIAQMMAIYYFLRVLSGWRDSIGGSWEKALEELLFASSRIFVFLLIVDGAFLSAKPQGASQMLSSELLIMSGPFHIAAFLLGILLVGFFQGRLEYRRELTGLSLFAWKSEPILWVTLLLATFLNTSAFVGAANFLVLAGLSTLILFVLNLVRSHMPKVRMDQIERLGLSVVYPVALLIFLGMWWQETFR